MCWVFTCLFYYVKRFEKRNVLKALYKNKVIIIIIIINKKIYGVGKCSLTLVNLVHCTSFC